MKGKSLFPLIPIALFIIVASSFAPSVVASPKHNLKPPVNIDYRQYEKGSSLEVVFQKEHSKAVSDVQYSPDGKLLVTASEDRTVQIRNSDGVLLKTIYIPDIDIYKNIRWLKITPDGKQIVVQEDSALYVFSITGNLIKKYSGDEYDFYCAEMSPDGKTIVTVPKPYSANYKISIRNNLWEVTKELDLESGEIVKCIAFSPNGKFFVSGGTQYVTEQGWNASAKMWKRKIFYFFRY